jgi:hypothetical protein
MGAQAPCGEQENAALEGRGAVSIHVLSRL